MIITLEECKTLLKITNTTYDDLINLNIPIIEELVCDYCNNDFINYNWDSICSSAIEFSSVDNSILLPNSTHKLIAGDSIRIYGSLRNDNVFSIESVVDNKLIISSLYEVITENENNSVIIYKVKYPKSLKLNASKLINYNLQKMKGFKSESIDNYSYTLEDLDGNGYPKTLVAGLNLYRDLFKRKCYK